MADIYHWFGDDVQFDVNGDLETVDGSLYTKQRIVKRLLTVPGSYLWQPDYGAGVGQYIGQNLTPDLYQLLQGLIISQVLKESAVAQNPKPTVKITSINQQGVSGLQVDIMYYDLEQQTQYLSFPVTP